MKTIHEPARELPIVADVDVLVAGGGPAGLIAATAAARTGALVTGDTLGGVIIENKSGRGAVRARVCVDATGDGDLLGRSGAEFNKSEGELQPMTLVFMISGATTQDGLDQATRQRVKQEVEAGTFPVPKPLTLFALSRPGEYYANCTRIAGDCTNAWDLTSGEVEGRRQAMAIIEWLRKNAPGFENCRLLSTAPHVGTRESRRMIGVYELNRDDVLSYRRFDDDVVQCHYYIDIHKPGKGNEATHLEPGKSYGIPYRCLVPKRLDGLIVAGRCISATHEALGSARVMAIAMAMGHAAGTAAALAATAGIAPRQLDPAKLRATLRQQGALL